MPEEATAREFCSKYGIAIFEVKPFTEAKETFGKIGMKVRIGETPYDIVVAYEKVRDAYMFFAPIGWDIASVSNFTHPMSDEDTAIVMKKLATEYAEEMQKESGTKKEMQNISNVILDTDPELDKMKRIATQAIADMDELSQKLGAGFSLRKTNELKAISEELKKVRMGSNSSKMRSLISDSYRLMEDVEMEFLDQQKVTEVSLIADSVVTHLDLVREYEKYEKAQKVKKGKLDKTPSDTYYIFFGKAGMYQKFLGKEFEKKFENATDILYVSIDYLVIFIYMCILRLTLSSLYQHFILQETVFFFAFIDFGLMGIILTIINKIKRKSMTQLLVLLAAGVILYIAARYLLISNFAF